MADAPPLLLIVLGGLAMSSIALVGAATLVLPIGWQQRMRMPLVAFAAGALLGGALFHMLPGAVERMGNGIEVYLGVAVGFVSFQVLEVFLHWHHCHREDLAHVRPLTYLLLLADGVHNLVGGLAVGAAFLVSPELGTATWLAAAAHEVPQELGDFGVLVHGGWSPRRALTFNLLSGLTFLVGGVAAWALSGQLDTTWLLPFAAGNFIYIAATDLVPEILRHPRLRGGLLHLLSFCSGLALLAWLHHALEAHAGH
jgi:zinc and cadmium transporter